jgi:hypothetical protein
VPEEVAQVLKVVRWAQAVDHSEPGLVDLMELVVVYHPHIQWER